jgi:hypothetical protein
MELSTWIGMVGVAGILLAYFLQLFNQVSNDNYSYLILNILGASMACVSSIMIESVPFTILEGTWTIVSIIGWLKKMRGKSLAD